MQSLFVRLLVLIAGALYVKRQGLHILVDKCPYLY